MSPHRKISIRQLELLLDFAETHRDIALGRNVRGYPTGPQAAPTIRALWKCLALRLNAIGSGVTKSGDQWRRYWIELKAKTKAKAADSRRSAAEAGGGPTKISPLREHEKRLLAIIEPTEDECLPIKIPSDDEDTRDPLAAGFRLAGKVTPPSVDNYSTEEELEEEWLETESPRATPSPSADLQPAQEESRCKRAPPSTSPRPPPIKRDRLSRQFPESVTKWAYDIENRRIAAEEQQAAAMEGLAVGVARLQEQMRRQADATEALVDIVRSLITSS